MEVAGLAGFLSKEVCNMGAKGLVPLLCSTLLECFALELWCNHMEIVRSWMFVVATVAVLLLIQSTQQLVFILYNSGSAGASCSSNCELVLV